MSFEYESSMTTSLWFTFSSCRNENETEGNELCWRSMLIKRAESEKAENHAENNRKIFAIVNYFSFSNVELSVIWKSLLATLFSEWDVQCVSSNQVMKCAARDRSETSTIKRNLLRWLSKPNGNEKERERKIWSRTSLRKHLLSYRLLAFSCRFRSTIYLWNDFPYRVWCKRTQQYG